MTPTRHWLGSATLAVVTAAAFGPTLTAPLVGDDFEELLGSRDGGFLGAQRLDRGRNFRPITDLAHRLSDAAWGSQPIPHHVSSLLLHLLSAAGVFAMTKRLARRSERATVAAALAGGFFALHPSHTEAVSWVSGRASLIMTVAALASLTVWVGPQGEIPVRATEHWRRVLASQALFLVALLSYEPAMAVPFVATAWAIAGHGRQGVRAAGPFFATTGVWVFLRLVAFGGIATTPWRDELLGADPGRTLVKLGVTLARSVTGGFDFGGILGLVVIPASAIAFVARTRTDTRTDDAGTESLSTRLAVASFVAATLAILPVAALGVSLWDTGGERLIYLPSALASVGIGMAIGRFPRPMAVAMAAVITLSSTAMLVAAQLRWRDGADTAGRLIDAMAELPRDAPAVVLGQPDSLQGAIVARNALGPDRVLLAAWEPPAPIHVAATYDLGSTGSTAIAEVERGGGDITLRLIGPDARFLETEGPNSTWDVPGLTTTRTGDATIRVALPEPLLLPDAEGRPTPATVWWFDGHQLRPLER